MILSQKGKQFLKAEEGFKSCPYKDSVGIPTIGIGSTVYPNGAGVTMSDPCITVDKAYEYLDYHVQKRIIVVIKNSILKTLNQNQVDAILSLCYNIGAVRFLKSTLLKKINEDPNNKEEISKAFLLWSNAGSKPVLKPRRQREVNLYFSP